MYLFKKKKEMKLENSQSLHLFLTVYYFFLQTDFVLLKKKTSWKDSEKCKNE